ncbi:MAG: hypothetical protein HYS20_09220 [Rhodocyclales bacterium]|nr:hypothetical protein [Rhodocyclales bacterium]
MGEFGQAPDKTGEHVVQARPCVDELVLQLTLLADDIAQAVLDVFQLPHVGMIFE